MSLATFFFEGFFDFLNVQIKDFAVAYFIFSYLAAYAL
jgi:hypothetical protein